MATSKSSLSSLEFHTAQSSSGSRDCSQPAAGASELSSGQQRCRVDQQTSYLKGDSRREFFSSKDAAKRKRVNRIAKLKQCKLDARREQWLSQGSRCMPIEHKEVVQHLTRKEQKNVSPAIKNVGKDVTKRDFGCHSHDAISSNFLNEGNFMKQNDVSLSPTPCLAESVKGPSNINIMKILEVGETGKAAGKPPLLPQTAQDDDSCNYKRPGDPHSGPRYSKDAQVERKITQSNGEDSGNICCADNCYVPDLVCSGHGNSQLCNESSVIRLDHIAGGPKLLDEEELSQENHEDICRLGCRTDQLPCSNCFRAIRNISETEPEVSNLSIIHECEDDWERAADALSAPRSSLIKNTTQLPVYRIEEEELKEQKGKASGVTNLQNGVLKPEYKFKAAGHGFKSRGGGGRAWRPDDVLRPPTLPPLSKQLSFQEESTSVWSGTQNRSNVWGPPQLPSYCPICTEELDLTDSSFFPCSCGFRLCLFCHHRISSDDGRCPGCREVYSPDVAMKLSRTTSWLRV